MPDRWGRLARLVDAGRSTVVRIATPVIDVEVPFRDQIDTFEECLRAAHELAGRFRRANQR